MRMSYLPRFMLLFVAAMPSACLHDAEPPPEGATDDDALKACPQPPPGGDSSIPRVTATPPYRGSNFADGRSGAGMIRRGPLARVNGWVYTGDALSAFRRARGGVRPAMLPGLLSNPHRSDGTALSAGYYIPSTFTGHIPVFTEGNRWPFVGPAQPQPPHGDFEADAGLYFVNGASVNTVEPLLVPGAEGAIVVNKTPYSVLLSSGSYPGNEQPGQTMTPISPGETAALPIPPKGWYPDASGNPRVPELYASVAGLDPVDAVGWHVSNTSPDYGTPGFAYTFGGKYTKIPGQPRDFLFVGFNKNEGYDPSLSGDPGYGVALYTRDASGGADALVAVTDIRPTGTGRARQDLWALPQMNPQVNAQGGLSAFPAAIEGTTFVYTLVTHEAAQGLLVGKSVLHHDY